MVSWRFMPKNNRFSPRIAKVGLNGEKRYVDFNQGIDLRLLTKERMKKSEGGQNQKRLILQIFIVRMNSEF